MKTSKLISEIKKLKKTIKIYKSELPDKDYNITVNCILDDTDRVLNEAIKDIPEFKCLKI